MKLAAVFSLDRHIVIMLQHISAHLNTMYSRAREHNVGNWKGEGRRFSDSLVFARISVVIFPMMGTSIEFSFSKYLWDILKGVPLPKEWLYLLSGKE